MKRILAVFAIAVGLIVTAATPASADPEPGGNNPAYVCAPGQQGNPHPGFKPPACDPGTGNK